MDAPLDMHPHNTCLPHSRRANAAAALPPPRPPAPPPATPRRRRSSTMPTTPSLTVCSVLFFAYGVQWAGAAQTNWTIPRNEPRINYLPRDGWADAEPGLAGVSYRRSQIPGASATVIFRGQALFYNSPLLLYDASIVVEVDGRPIVLNLTDPRLDSSPNSTGPFAVGELPLSSRTFVVEQGLAETEHRVVIKAAPGSEDATMASLIYTAEDLTSPITLPAHTNLSLVVPLAVVGSLLFLAILTILLIWVFKFPHLCCAPVRRKMLVSPTSSAGSGGTRRDRSRSLGVGVGGVSGGVAEVGVGGGRGVGGIGGGAGSWKSESDLDAEAEIVGGTERGSAAMPSPSYYNPANLLPFRRNRSNTAPTTHTTHRSTTHSQASKPERNTAAGAEGEEGGGERSAATPFRISFSFLNPSTWLARRAKKQQDRDSLIPTPFPVQMTTDARGVLDDSGRRSHTQTLQTQTPQGAVRRDGSSTNTNTPHPRTQTHSVASPIREARQLAMDLPYLQYLDALGDTASSVGHAGRSPQVLSLSPRNLEMLQVEARELEERERLGAGGIGIGRKGGNGVPASTDGPKAKTKGGKGRGGSGDDSHGGRAQITNTPLLLSNRGPSARDIGVGLQDEDEDEDEGNDNAAAHSRSTSLAVQRANTRSHQTHQTHARTDSGGATGRRTSGRTTTTLVDPDSPVDAKHRSYSKLSGLFKGKGTLRGNILNSNDDAAAAAVKVVDGKGRSLRVRNLSGGLQGPSTSTTPTSFKFNIPKRGRDPRESVNTATTLAGEDGDGDGDGRFVKGVEGVEGLGEVVQGDKDGEGGGGGEGEDSEGRVVLLSQGMGMGRKGGMGVGQHISQPMGPRSPSRVGGTTTNTAAPTAAAAAAAAAAATIVSAPPITETTAAPSHNPSLNPSLSPSLSPSHNSSKAQTHAHRTIGSLSTMDSGHTRTDSYGFTSSDGHLTGHSHFGFGRGGGSGGTSVESHGGGSFGSFGGDVGLGGGGAIGGGKKLPVPPTGAGALVAVSTGVGLGVARFAGLGSEVERERERGGGVVFGDQPVRQEPEKMEVGHGSQFGHGRSLPSPPPLATLAGRDGGSGASSNSPTPRPAHRGYNPRLEDGAVRVAEGGYEGREAYMEDGQFGSDDKVYALQRHPQPHAVQSQHILPHPVQQSHPQPQPQPHPHARANENPHPHPHARTHERSDSQADVASVMSASASLVGHILSRRPETPSDPSKGKGVDYGLEEMGRTASPPAGRRPLPAPPPGAGSPPPQASRASQQHQHSSQQQQGQKQDVEGQRERSVYVGAEGVEFDPYESADMGGGVEIYEPVPVRLPPSSFGGKGVGAQQYEPTGQATHSQPQPRPPPQPQPQPRARPSQQQQQNQHQHQAQHQNQGKNQGQDPPHTPDDDMDDMYVDDPSHVQKYYYAQSSLSHHSNQERMRRLLMMTNPDEGVGAVVPTVSGAVVDAVVARGVGGGVGGERGDRRGQQTRTHGRPEASVNRPVHPQSPPAAYFVDDFGRPLGAGGASSTAPAVSSLSSSAGAKAKAKAQVSGYDPVWRPDEIPSVGGGVGVDDGVARYTSVSGTEMAKSSFNRGVQERSGGGAAAAARSGAGARGARAVPPVGGGRANQNVNLGGNGYGKGKSGSDLSLGQGERFGPRTHVKGASSSDTGHFYAAGGVRY